jgi:hypothetical protein
LSTKPSDFQSLDGSPGSGSAPTPTSCSVCGRTFTTIHGLRTHGRVLRHNPDDSCRSCGVDLKKATRKPSDRAHYQYYCLKCSRERDKAYSRKYNKGPRAQERSRAYLVRLKLATLRHYSPLLVCQCTISECWHDGPCRVSDWRVLCIDHIGGGGGRHRKSIITPFYNWLKRNGYPDGFQVLCENCNWMKTRVNHEHRKRNYSVGSGTKQ